MTKRMVIAVAGTLTTVVFFSLFLFGIDFGGYGHSLTQMEGLPSPSRLLKFKTAVVSSDGAPCSKVGRYRLRFKLIIQIKNLL